MCSASNAVLLILKNPFPTNREGDKKKNQYKARHLKTFLLHCFGLWQGKTGKRQINTRNREVKSCETLFSRALDFLRLAKAFLAL